MGRRTYLAAAYLALASALALVGGACLRASSAPATAAGSADGGGGTAAWQEPVLAPVAMARPLAADPPPITGRTFYVATDGADGQDRGSAAQPWKTITYALNQLYPGDGVLIRGGTYREGDLIPARSGEPGRYITVRAYPGETVKVDASGHVFGIVLSAGDPWPGPGRSYLVFDGLDISGCNQQLCIIEGSQGCHHIWVINCKLHDNKRCAPLLIGGPGSSHCVVSNNEIYNSPGSCGVGGYPYSHDNVFEWNDLHHVSGDDDDAGAFKACNAYSTLMRYNRVHDNNRNPRSRVPFYGATPEGQWKTCQGITGLYFDWSRDGDFPGARSYCYNNAVCGNDAGVQVWCSRNVSIFNNVICSNGTFSSGSWAYGSGEGGEPTWVAYYGAYGMGLTAVADDKNPNTGLLIAHNTIYGNARHGLNLGHVRDSRIVNNIIARNQGCELNAWSVSLALDSNLYFDPGGPPLISYEFKEYANLADLRRALPSLEANGLEGDPAFAQADGFDFHLSPVSPARKIGVHLPEVPFDCGNAIRSPGPATDAGAFGYGARTTQ